MRSIKAKLIMLGAVSIVCTVILGLVGIYIMNSNNANNQVLNDINNINLKQNENTTQEPLPDDSDEPRLYGGSGSRRTHVQQGRAV